MKSGTLELSTVDIASEFVRIITLQRGFQASSRIITTINQLLNEIIQLAG
ncbi:MAG: flagellar basal body rod C-terminal domain-containing protein [bacterium]